MTDTARIDSVNVNDGLNIPLRKNININEIPLDGIWKETKTDSNNDKKMKQNFVSFGDIDDDDCENFESFVPAFSAISEV